MDWEIVFQVFVIFSLVVLGLLLITTILFQMIGLTWIYFSPDGYQICEENRVDGYELTEAWSNQLSGDELHCWYATQGNECLTEFKKTKEFGVVVVYQSC